MPLLTTANYSLWADAMEDYLHAKGYWFQIHTPPPTQIADPKGWKCMEARDSAVGEIRRHLSPELRSVSLSSNDPQAILNAIKAAYGTSSFARFNAMQAFLAVKQETSETVAVFISRAREALRLLQSTRPPSASLVTPAGSGPFYPLEDSDRELLISVLLNGTKYSALTTCLHNPI